MGGGDPEKAIVFSQWTSMLDLLEEPLRRHGFEFRRLDGTMSSAQRERALADFTDRPAVTVILMSLKARPLPSIFSHLALGGARVRVPHA